MQLSRKVNLFIALVFVALILLYIQVQQLIIMPSFVSLEKEMAVDNTERVLEAIDNEFNQLAPIASDWAYWTTTYDYVLTKDETYEKEVLVGSKALIDLKMNYIGIYDVNGNAVWNRAIDLSTGKVLDIGLLSGKKLPAKNPLLQLHGLTDEVCGIIPTPHAPMLVVAKSILTNENKGPTAGTFILGKFLDEACIHSISQQTKFLILASQPTSNAAPALIHTHTAHESIPHTQYRLVTTQDYWKVYTTLLDLHKKPILTLQVDTARDISTYGAMAVKHSLWLLITAGLAVMFVLWKFLQLAVIAPITTLTNHTIKIGNNNMLDEHVEIKGKDEIGVLSKTFNQMIDRLAESRKQLIEQSYRSGANDLASGTLHNIRNTITPLSVRLSTLQQALKTAPLSEIRKAAEELIDPTTPQERLNDLLQFLKLATEDLERLLEKSYDELTLSIQQIGRVEKCLVDKRLLPHSDQLIEPICMLDVINEVKKRLGPEVRDTINIEIEDSVEKCSNIVGTQAALQLVVENILINAAESIATIDRNKGCVIISAKKKVTPEQSMVEYLFTDNGAGVDHNHIDHLFERDFSTKNRNGAGFGLHWSSNTIQALGGQMFIESPGIGHGATVHILLPLA
ncbi:CHASE4 domain-containing protein [Halodesulfovibrio marinisediminis]|uniref:histidine kinase n=1 Tax=Halodesulfovibrio marinisediminis DSM 17456 TaxID=1121457 RepID=A0A1N6EB04_9BACT|nr:CHASE4 domain-containing protein [Halodesulfovibrio marinisediminis]SIN80151.1 sensor domain CHASE-containing protein [Halodesulfovibrio marinisediminis DSM 17456]